MTAMRPGAVQEDEQRTAEVSQQRFEKVDHLFSGNGAFMQAKAQAREVHAGDQRQLVPVEMKLQRRRLASDTPGAHPRGPLRDSGLVDEDDQSSLASGVFFSAGQVRLRPCSMAASSRSKARRSGFWFDKPSCPSKRQTCTSLYRTPNSRSINSRTRLSVHSGVAKPCAVAPSSSITYSRDDAAGFEHVAPAVHRLSRRTDQARDFRRTLACKQQPTGTYSPFDCLLGVALRLHAESPMLR